MEGKDTHQPQNSGSLIVGGKERQNKIENKGTKRGATMYEQPPVSSKEKI